jgi:pentatricopeptide repeat protein
LGKTVASHFCANNWSCIIALNLCSVSGSYSTTNFEAQSKVKFNTENFNEGFGKVGNGFSGELGFAASVNDNAEEEDEMESEGEEKEGSDIDESLEFISSFHGNDNKNKQRENIARFEIDESEFRHPLVREVCRLITLRSTWNPKFEGNLRHLLRSLKPRLVCAVLRSQVDERIALNYFYWADQQWRYRHDTIVYYTMLDILSKTKLCQGARRILRLMRRRGIECSPEAFGYVMVSYSRAGKLRNALRVLTLMQKAGVEPDLSICNTAIYVLVKGNKLEKALRFLERMQVVGIEPDVVTYNCLIKGYCDLHRIDDALKLIAEMPSKGCPPDKVSYYTVMAFLCKDRKVEEVKRLLENMVQNSHQLCLVN